MERHGGDPAHRRVPAPPTGGGVPGGVDLQVRRRPGPYLAALITYYGFLSLFPLLLLATSILGFVLDGDPELQAADPRLHAQPVPGDRRAARRAAGPAGQPGRRSSSAGSSLSTARSVSPRRSRTHRTWPGRCPRNRRPNPLRRGCAASGLLAVGRHRDLGDHGPVGPRRQRHAVRRRPRRTGRVGAVLRSSRSRSTSAPSCSPFSMCTVATVQHPRCSLPAR